MIREKAFQPNVLTTAQIDNTVLTAGAASLNTSVMPGQVLRLVNTHATQTAYINFGRLIAVAATTNDMPIRSGSEIYIVVPNDCNYMAYIATGASTLVYMTKGN